MWRKVREKKKDVDISIQVAVGITTTAGVLEALGLLNSIRKG